MTIRTKRKEDQLTLTITGKINASTVPILKMELISLQGLTLLALDFSGVTALDKPGLNFLKDLRQQLPPETRMEIAGSEKAVKKTLEQEGFPLV